MQNDEETKKNKIQGNSGVAAADKQETSFVISEPRLTFLSFGMNMKNKLPPSSFHLWKGEREKS